jgi:hypothetical protein
MYRYWHVGIERLQNFLCVPSCAAASIIFVVAIYLHPAMCANTCRIIFVRPLRSSLADLSVRNKFHLLRRSPSRHAVYICSHLLHMYRTAWSIDTEIVFLPSAVYRSYSRAAVLPHVGVTIHSGTGPFHSKYPLLRQYLLSPDRPAIKNLQEVGGSCGDWMEVAQDRDRWRMLVGTVRNLRVPKMRGISWLAAEPVSFSRRTLLHGVSK